MGLVVSSTAVAELYGSPRIVLCEASVAESFRTAVPTTATIVLFQGNRIGGKGGRAVALDEIGLPAALEMIVAPEKSRTAATLLELVRSSRFPRNVPLIEITQRKNAKVQIAAAYLKAIDQTVAGLQAQTLARETEVVTLRRSVETHGLKNSHLSEFLGTLGYASQELIVEQPVDLSQTVTAPLRQRLQVLGSEIAGISVMPRLLQLRSRRR